MVVNLVPKREYSPICSSRERFSNVTDVNHRQRKKLSLSKTTTEGGIAMVFSPPQQNADSSIRSNREPLSNVTDSSDLQSLKHDRPIPTTDDGIRIVFSPLPQKASSSIPFNREPPSVTDSSDLQCKSELTNPEA
jgi:hypothetical protein